MLIGKVVDIVDDFLREVENLKHVIFRQNTGDGGNGVADEELVEAAEVSGPQEPPPGAVGKDSVRDKCTDLAGSSDIQQRLAALV